MESRCPGGQALGQAALHDWRFLINTRTYATIEAEPGAVTYGVLWSLTEEHIDSLDIYEAVDEGMYYKDTLTVLHQGQAVRRWFISTRSASTASRGRITCGASCTGRGIRVAAGLLETIARDWGGA